MKKIFWLLVTLALVAAIAAPVWNTWKATEFFIEHGRDATLKVGSKYNASRWATPLPLKKLHSFTGVLLPDHAVLIESDQDLKSGEEYFVQFLTRDVAEGSHAISWRPLVNTIRLKSEADGTPVRLADTDLMDRAVEKAMGPVGPMVYVKPRVVAEAAPDHEKPKVPFILAGANDTVIEILWNNSTFGEWLVLGIGLVLLNVIGAYALSLPWIQRRKSGTERADFVHPAMRRIDADAPDEASSRLVLKRGTGTEGSSASPATPPNSAPPPEVKKKTIAMPAKSKAPESPRRDGHDSRATTSPFVPPANFSEPELKLKRRDTPPPSDNPEA